MNTEPLIEKLIKDNTVSDNWTQTYSINFLANCEDPSKFLDRSGIRGTRCTLTKNEKALIKIIENLQEQIDRIQITKP